MPYLPGGAYANLRRHTMLWNQLAEDRIRNMNRLHWEKKIYFPEYKDTFGRVDGAFCMEILKVELFLEDILQIGADGIKEIWHAAKMRGRGYSRALEMVKYAEASDGLKEGTAVSMEAMKWFAEKISEFAVPTAIALAEEFKELVIIRQDWTIQSKSCSY